MSEPGMNDCITGQVSALQHFSTGDGPGIRTTVFLKGCTLRCSWCHNPETQASTPELMFFRNRCTSCGRCVAVCPTGVHRMIAAGQAEANQMVTAAQAEATAPVSWPEQTARPDSSGSTGSVRQTLHELDRSLCRQCGACVAVCPSEALQLNGVELSVESVMRFVLADVDFYQTSGGGVTLSGGEPLLQPDFCLALARACKEHDIHVIIDTAGQVPWAAFAQIIPFVDTFYYDLKGTCSDDYRQVTGGDFDLILSNLKRLVAIGAHVVACVVIIPGLNDDLATNERLADVLGTTGVKEVRLLAYHQLGRSKYEALGREYRLERRCPEQAADLTDEVKLREMQEPQEQRELPESLEPREQRELPEPPDRSTMAAILAIYERSFKTWLDG